MTQPLLAARPHIQTTHDVHTNPIATHINYYASSNIQMKLFLKVNECMRRRLYLVVIGDRTCCVEITLSHDVNITWSERHTTVWNLLMNGDQTILNDNQCHIWRMASLGFVRRSETPQDYIKSYCLKPIQQRCGTPLSANAFWPYGSQQHAWLSNCTGPVCQWAIGW